MPGCAKLLIISMLMVAGVFLKAGAQQPMRWYSLTGTVRDSVNMAAAQITVRLYNSADTLTTVTSNSGAYSFTRLRAGSYKIAFSGVNYKTYLYSITLKGAITTYSLAPVILLPEVISLREVIIKQKAIPIKIKQDTIEYNAGSYAVRTNDVMADLLRQLPGIRVDDNDNVTSLNKPVVKLRVNGKDFFTNNLQDYLRQLPAAIISKIQLIDDFGDEANYTGMKQGEPAKLINIVTHRNITRGVFGNTQVAAGTNKSLSPAATLNLWRDIKQTGINISTDLLRNNYEDQAKTEGGLTLRDELAPGVTGSLNYSFNAGHTMQTHTELSQQETAAGNLFTQGFAYEHEKFGTHNLNGNLQRVKNTGYLQASLTANLNNTRKTSATENIYSGLINNSSSVHATIPASGGSAAFNVIYARRKGEGASSYTVALNGSYLKSSGRQLYTNDFANTGGIYPFTSFITASRLILLDTKNLQAATDFKYRYQLNSAADSTSSSSLEFGYNFAVNSNANNFNTLQSGGGEKVTKVDSLSSAFTTTYITSRLGAFYIYKNARAHYNLGLNVIPTVLLTTATRLQDAAARTQILFTPAAKVNYYLRGNKTLNFGYTGTTVQPSWYQLQPVADYRNLQNVIIGNPELKPAFRHSLSANFSFSSLKTASSFFATATAATTQNQVTTNTTITADSVVDGVIQTTRFLNSSSNYQLAGTLNFSQPFYDNALQLGAITELGLYSTQYYLNNKESLNRRVNYTQTLNARLDRRYFAITAAGVYNLNSSQYLVSAQRIHNLSYLQVNVAASLNLPQLLVLETTATKTHYFNSYLTGIYNPLVINAALKRNFLKSRALQVSVEAFDILNRLQNISRTTTETAVTDIKINRVSRFVQLTLAYKLSKFGGQANPAF